MPKSNIYVQLDYDEYKQLEVQLRDWERIETAHRTVEGAYHKALRLDCGQFIIELQGPLVKAPIEAGATWTCPDCLHPTHTDEACLAPVLLSGQPRMGCACRSD